MTFRPFKLVAFLICLALGAGLTSCIERKAETQTKKESPVSGELAAMVREHEQMRATGKFPLDLIKEADLRHRQTVYQLMAQALIVEPGDLYRAAILLQSVDSTICTENAMMAYYCALESARKGYEDARRLSAEYFDKYLISSGLPQKYATQYYVDKSGKYQFYSYDSSTTDEDRATWNVPSLDSLKFLAAKAVTELPQNK